MDEIYIQNFERNSTPCAIRRGELESATSLLIEPLVDFD